MQRNGNEHTASPSETQKTWSRIWNLNIPPKVRIFLWKSAHDAIAAEANLAAHHIPCTPRCVLCRYHKADTNHVLFFCQAVKEAWKRTEWWQSIKNARRISSESMTIHWILTLEKRDLERVAMKMWGIWKERCDRTHSNQDSKNKTRLTAYWTDTLLDQFHQEMSKLSTVNDSPSNARDTESYTQLPDGHIMKVDAAYKEASAAYAVGYYIYDKGGKPLAAGYHKINPPGSVLAAEITAITHGLSVWKSLSQDAVSIFSDCKEAINEITTNNPFKGYEESLISKARRQIQDPCVQDIRYLPRQYTKEAHMLAQLATKSNHPHAWVGSDIPRHILSLAQDYFPM